MGHQRPGIADRIREVRVAEFPIEGIVKDRRSATRYGIFTILCFEIMWFAIYRTYHNISEHNYFWALLPGIGAILLGFFTWDSALQTRVEFLKAYRKFYLRRYVPALDALEDDGYNLQRITDKNALHYWEFYWAKDLKQFEQALFDYLRSFRRAEDLYRRQAKWVAANAKLTNQLEVVLDEFEITGDRRQEILSNFSFYQNPERRKEVLANYRSRIAHERWRQMNHWAQGVSGVHQLDQEPVGSEEDFRLRYLEKEASTVTSDSAKRFYRTAIEATSRREKIRLFKRALSQDVLEAGVDGEVVAAVATIAKVPNKAAVAEVKHLSLQEFARERLIPFGQFARETEWLMWREIVLALARPGQSGGRFNKHYFAEDTVKRMVRRQCDMYADIPFKPSDFDEAVSWLLKNGVLVTKPKVDERTLSLSTNVKNATPEGAQIISMILRLKREMSGLPN